MIANKTDYVSAQKEGRPCKKLPRLIIGADFVPTASNYVAFTAGDGEALVGGELLRLISSADFSVF